MFGKGLRLFKVLGFEVRVDSSWLLLAVLIILSLTSGYFPFHYKGLSSGAYVLMGILGAIGHQSCGLLAAVIGAPRARH